VGSTRSGPGCMSTKGHVGALPCRKMRSMLRVLCVALCAAQAVLPAAQSSVPKRRLLDVIVFFADPVATEQYPPEVRLDLERYLQRLRAYRPRPRPPGLGSEMAMVYAAREGFERKLVAGSEVAGVEPLAQQYVDRLRPCYEWEGFHDCPEREAVFADQYLAQNPDTPFREFLRLLAAHRWLCTAEAYDYEQKSAGAERARREFERAVTVVEASRSALMKAAAGELRATNRCHASDPFRGK
jgi:hypothetical protein